jgi:hypothetical protein
MEIYNLPLEKMSYVEIKSLELVLKEYRSMPPSYDALLDETFVGYNSNSGYTYIALECGITLGCNDGNTVEYIVTDTDTGEEYFEEDINDALDRINSFEKSY